MRKKLSIIFVYECEQWTVCNIYTTDSIWKATTTNVDELKRKEETMTTTTANIWSMNNTTHSHNGISGSSNRTRADTDTHIYKSYCGQCVLHCSTQCVYAWTHENEWKILYRNVNVWFLLLSFRFFLFFLIYAHTSTTTTNCMTPRPIFLSLTIFSSSYIFCSNEYFLWFRDFDFFFSSFRTLLDTVCVCACVISSRAYYRAIRNSSTQKYLLVLVVE